MNIMSKYQYLVGVVWEYVERGQYDPYNADAYLENIQDEISNAMDDGELTHDELDSLNKIYDTGIEWEENA